MAQGHDFRCRHHRAVGIDRDAAMKMIQQEKGPLPVVEGRKAVAMVTDRDIIARVVAAGKNPGSLSVKDIATQDLVTVSPEADVNEARS
jgi:CBS domain-containing protein